MSQLDYVVQSDVLAQLTLTDAFVHFILHSRFQTHISRLNDNIVASWWRSSVLVNRVVSGPVMFPRVGIRWHWW